jgi:bacterial/archaeal transporter family-2 protein
VTATRLAIVLSFAAGLSGAAQASISGAFGRRIGVVQAAAFGAVLGAALLVALAVVLGRGGGILAGVHHPPWLWLIGLFGAAIVVSIAYAPPVIGTFATVALLIAGQLVAGALIDAFGILGSPRIPVTFHRVVGLALVAAGAALTLRR